VKFHFEDNRIFKINHADAGSDMLQIVFLIWRKKNAAK
jgi:hypothetical protein